MRDRGNLTGWFALQLPLAVVCLAGVSLIGGCSGKTRAPVEGTTASSSGPQSSPHPKLANKSKNHVRAVLVEPKVVKQGEGNVASRPPAPPPQKPPSPAPSPGIIFQPHGPIALEDLKRDPTQALLETYKRALQRGLIEYNPPAFMTVGRSETVMVRVHRAALDSASAESSPRPALPGTTVSSPLSVYPTMRVSLTTNSGGAFSITPDPQVPTTQTIPDNSFAEWRWQVSPLLAGPGKVLVVEAWADLTSQHLDPILVQEYVADVDVQVAPAPPPPTMAQRAWTFVQHNWQWLWATIVLPLGGWLVHRFTRKKSNA